MERGCRVGETPNVPMHGIRVMMTSEATGETSPAVGEQFPDFTLPDQHGNIVALSDIRAGRAAMIVFVRSADW